MPGVALGHTPFTTPAEKKSLPNLWRTPGPDQPHDSQHQSCDHEFDEEDEELTSQESLHLNEHQHVLLKDSPPFRHAADHDDEGDENTITEESYTNQQGGELLEYYRGSDVDNSVLEKSSPQDDQYDAEVTGTATVDGGGNRRRRQHAHLDIDPHSLANNTTATRGAIPVPARYKDALEKFKWRLSHESSCQTFFPGAEESSEEPPGSVRNQYLHEKTLWKHKNQVDGTSALIPSMLTKHHRRLQEKGLPSSSIPRDFRPLPQQPEHSVPAPDDTPPPFTLAALRSPYREEERKTRLAKIAAKHAYRADSYAETQRSVAMLPTTYISPQQRGQLHLQR